MEEISNCHLCNNSKFLTQKGILKVYLFPNKLPLILMILGLIGGFVFSKYIFFLIVIGFIYPLVMADFRLYIYPVATIAHLLGKKLNCPKCLPDCTVFGRK